MQHKKPIVDKLAAHSGSSTISFHVPGHKNGNFYNSDRIELWGNILNIDLTEIPGMDNLHCPVGIIEEAQYLTAQAYGVDRTYFLVNGSTAGILATLFGTAHSGDKILVDRCCHSSVLNGLMLGRLKPKYIGRPIDKTTGIPLAVNLIELKKTIEDYGAKVLIITNPNYYGVCSNIRAIEELAHKHGILLIVDEAHGAHFKFSKELPESAVDAGADLVVQSAHKTLPAMTQGSWLHVKGNRVDRDRLERMLGVFQTTSPSYPIMASLDMARYVMMKEGAERLKILLKNTRQTRKSINLMDRGLFSPGREYFKKIGCHDFDETKIIINCKEAGMNGYQLDYKFRKEKGIYGELYDLVNWLGVATCGNSRQDFEQLTDACGQVICTGKKISLPDFSMPVQEPCIDLWEVMQVDWQKISLEDAQGMTAAESIVPYPPGVPFVCPGERITAQVIEMMKLYSQLHINIKGYTEGQIEIVKRGNHS